MIGEAVPTPLASATRLLALQLGIFVALGLPDGALGVVWPAMRASFHHPTRDLGFVLAAGTVGYLLGSASTGRLIRSIGAGRMAWAATGLAAVAMLGETGAPSWALLLAAAGILGIARGSTDAGLNAYIAEHGGVRQLGLLHAAYGVGTTTAPLVATALLAAGWRWAWAILTVLTCSLAAWSWSARRGWPGDRSAHAARASAEVGNGPAGALAFGLTMLTFAVYVGAEFGTASWAFVLLTEQRGMGQSGAGIIVAGFWAMLTAGRLALWLAGDRLPKTRILNLSCTLALVGLAWLWADPASLGWLGIPLAGLGMGPVFPTLVALTPERLGAGRAAQAIGWSVAAASLGGTILSALAGVLPLAPTLAIYGLALLLCHLLLVATVRTAAAQVR